MAAPTPFAVSEAFFVCLLLAGCQGVPLELDEDFARKDGKSVATLGSQLAARGRCSAPQLPTITYSSALRESAVGGGEAYLRELSNPRTGERHHWVMTLCEDYSNARPASVASRQVPASALASDLYWKP